MAKARVSMGIYRGRVENMVPDTDPGMHLTVVYGTVAVPCVCGDDAGDTVSFDSLAKLFPSLAGMDTQASDNVKRSTGTFLPLLMVQG